MTPGAFLRSKVCSWLVKAFSMTRYPKDMPPIRTTMSQVSEKYSTFLSQKIIRSRFRILQLESHYTSCSSERGRYNFQKYVLWRRPSQQCPRCPLHLHRILLRSPLRFRNRSHDKISLSKTDTADVLLQVHYGWRAQHDQAIASLDGIWWRSTCWRKILFFKLWDSFEIKFL